MTSSVSSLDRLKAHLLRRAEAGDLDLPVLGKVAEEVMSLCSRPDGDARELAGILRHDQSMASHVLKVANSALYAPGMPIVSLQQAVSRLGLNAVRDIAVVVAMKSRVFDVRGHEARVALLFRHATLTALVAQEISRVRRRNVEEAFLGGLVHDVGCPILLQAVADLEKATGAAFPDLEVTDILDALHARVGYDLARSWSLPPRLCEAVLHHHDPERAEATEIAHLVSLADGAAHAFATGADPAAARDLTTHASLPALNLYVEDMERLLLRRDAILEAAECLS